MIADFALRLVFGAALMWVLLPRPKITAGFFRVQMLVALGLFVLAALALSGVTDKRPMGAVLPPHVGWIPCVVLAVVAYVGSIVWMLDRRGPGTICIGVIGAGAVLTLLGLRVDVTAGAGPAVLAALAEITSSSVAGGAVTAMLLGHWYLTATGMSLDPLKRANALLGAMLVLRAVIAGIGLAWGWALVATQTHVLWLVLRWLAGIAGPLAGVVMVRRILAYRNTQSATGVLFAVVVLVFIGELAAVLLWRELSVPM